LQTDLMETLRWLRVVGDTIFAFGIIGLGWFVLGLKTGHSIDQSTKAPFRDEPDSTKPRREAVTAVE
jgi:nitric oxide reductase subunit B